MDNAARKFILGSNGKLDYLLIAEKTNIQLGLKVIVEDAIFSSGPAKTTKTLVGLRIRSAPAKSQDGPDILIGEKMLVSAWPGIQFGKTDNTRASTFIGGIANATIVTSEDLTKFLDEFKIVDSLVTFVCEVVPAEELLYSKEGLAEYLSEAFSEIAGTRPQQAAPAASSNVVDLQAAALAKLKSQFDPSGGTVH